MSFQKNLKNVDIVIQVFTLLHFEIANWHFRCETLLYMQHYIGIVHFLIKIQWLPTGLYLITLRFYVFFQNPRFLPCLLRFLELWCSEIWQRQKRPGFNVAYLIAAHCAVVCLTDNSTVLTKYFVVGYV